MPDTKYRGIEPFISSLPNMLVETLLRILKKEEMYAKVLSKCFSYIVKVLLKGYLFNVAPFDYF